MYAIFEKLCKEHGVTPYRVSKDTGIATATLSDWKTGKSQPKSDKMKILAAYFGVSQDYLETGEESPAAPGVEFVREECKRRGISIAQLEKDLGFSNGYLNPKKNNGITYKRAKLIAEYLNVDINLVLGEDAGEENIPHQEHYTDPETAKIAEGAATNRKLRALFSMQCDMNPDEIDAFYNLALTMHQKAERLDQDDPC